MKGPLGDASLCGRGVELPARSPLTLRETARAAALLAAAEAAAVEGCGFYSGRCGSLRPNNPYCGPCSAASCRV